MIAVLFFIVALIYLFPLLQGLILLPLDLLISNYSPWLSPATILLKNPYMQDSVVQLFPWRHLTFSSLTQGIIPLWNPYQHMGMPFMAGLKPMVFYPLNLLFILGESTSWNALLFLQIFLALVFAYTLARDLKLGVFPSALVSFGFSLNSLMVGTLEFGSDGHSLLWLPLLLFCVKRYLDTTGGKYLIFLALSLASAVLAGQLQYVGYSLVLLFAFILFYGRLIKARVSRFVSLFISIVLGLGISAVQLVPSIELFSHSHRGLLDPVQAREIFTRGLISPFQLARLFAPDFFGNPVSRDLSIAYIETSGYFGIIPLFFSLIAIFFIKNNSITKFFSTVFIASLLLSLKGVGEILYLFKIPVLTSGSGDRVFSLVLFSGAILSGFGVHEFMRSGNTRKKIFSLVLFSLAYIAIVAVGVIVQKINGQSVTAFLYNFRYSSLILIVFSIVTTAYLYFPKKTLFMLFVISLTFFDLFRLGYRFLTFSNEKFLYPALNVTKFVKEASQESLSRTFGLAEPELPTFLGVYTAETYNPLYLTRTGFLMQTLQGKRDEKISKDNKNIFTSDGDDLKRSLDFLGISLIVVGVDENPSLKYFHTDKFESNFDLLYKDDRHVVYRNTGAFPRFGLYYEAQEVKSDEEALDNIANGSIDFRKIILLEEKLPILEPGTGSAKLINSTVNSLSFETKTNTPALFYISDTYFPGWEAKVNGKTQKIYRANYNFRAVLVPEGDSTVEFMYAPSSFRLGVVISVVSLLLVAGLSLFQSKNSKRH